MAQDFSNTSDVIDSRDVIERIEELQGDISALRDDLDENQQGDNAATLAEIADLEAELAPLLSLQDEAEGSPDWQYGEALIHEDYFTEYCKELVEDCYHDSVGKLSELPEFISVSIDWDETAENMKADYFEVDYDGETYFIRS